MEICLLVMGKMLPKRSASDAYVLEIGDKYCRHFAVADPILKLLCSYWGLKVCGEVWGNYFCCRVLN